ncbi:MAG TPA: PhzF family phenazine biosynthesis protein [Rhizomicrobium sp.]|nr:PhzF family phenazine biosynthesis protein [Rhizomicrobium sp.]
MEQQLYITDVFGQAPFSGNPLPVILGAAGLSDDRMQAITRWFNVSETTFVLPPSNPGADYHVRIFTPARELPFAGHPTLGSCCAWLAAGGKPRKSDVVVQQCAAGLIPIRRVDGRLAFAAPPLLRSGPADKAKRAELAAFLDIAVEDIVDAEWVDNGPGWVAVLLKSAEQVLAVRPQTTAATQTDVGVVGQHRAGGPADFELRAFYTDQNLAVREDPVTGSLNASVAQWLFATGRAKDRYTAAQGTCIGYTGRVELTIDGNGQVWVGGKTLALAGGPLTVPL